MKISIVQTNSGSIVADNLAIILKAMTTAVEAEAPDLIALPEYALCLTGDRQVAERNAQDLDDSEPVSVLACFAASHRTAVHLGSVVERSADGRYYNSSVVFGPSGARLAQYRKRNLFATERPEWRGSVVHNEATFLSAGEAPTTFDLQGITFGNSICYDLRFPEIYQTLRAEGALVIFAPSAFTAVTGERDWAMRADTRAGDTR